MFPPPSKHNDDKDKSAKVDTRYYDELFIKIKDQESEEFKDSESIGRFK